MLYEVITRMGEDERVVSATRLDDAAMDEDDDIADEIETGDAAPEGAADPEVPGEQD